MKLLQGALPLDPGIYRFGFQGDSPPASLWQTASTSLTSLILPAEGKRSDAVWRRPLQTRYGAHVASQRCTILRSGKALTV